MSRSEQGFTLIEVLLALMIIAIGLTTLLKTMAQDIQTTQRLKDKTLEHILGMSAMAQIQMNTVSGSLNHEMTHPMVMSGQTWYWRAKLSPTPIKSMQQITVSVSHHQIGPFTHNIIGYRYTP